MRTEFKVCIVMTIAYKLWSNKHLIILHHYYYMCYEFKITNKYHIAPIFETICYNYKCSAKQLRMGQEPQYYRPYHAQHFYLHFLIYSFGMKLGFYPTLTICYNRELDPYNYFVDSTSLSYVWLLVIQLNLKLLHNEQQFVSN